MQGTPSLQELKLMYYNLLIRYHEHYNNYVDICRCYRSIYEVGPVNTISVAGGIQRTSVVSWWRLKLPVGA
jgi:hypothetical protein